MRRDQDPLDYQYHQKKYYDDDLMRKAEKNVNMTNYIVIGKNCQNYANRLRKEYNRLFKQLPKNEQQRILQEKKKTEAQWRKEKKTKKSKSSNSNSNTNTESSSSSSTNTSTNPYVDVIIDLTIP